MSNPRKEDTSPATKSDIADLRQIIVERFGEIDKRLDTHDHQFELLLNLLSRIQEDVTTTKNDLRILADKVLDDHERRLMACERRLGLAV